MRKEYVISAEWGEYDDYTYVPVFICRLQIEAQLLTEALNNREGPYWRKYTKDFPDIANKNARFYWKELEVFGL